MKHLQVITWARWNVNDPLEPEYYTVFTASILKPSWEYPFPCASMAIRKGKNKLFMRMSYQALINTFRIPVEYLDRLNSGYREALNLATSIQEKQRQLHKLNSLPPGTQLVRTDTGEIIAEAERILREADR